MAGKIPDLNVSVRTGTGKGAARQSRRDGNVPGTVYGGGQDPIAIEIPFNALFKRLKAGRFLATLFNLKIEGQEDVRVVCRDVQRDKVKDLPIHLDLMRLRRDSRVAMSITVEFINHEESPGLANQGGSLNTVRPEVELSVIASDIPDHITVDLAGLNVGATISISDIDLPKGAEPTIERDFIIATIAAPGGASEETDEAEGEEAEGEEAAAEGDAAES